MITFQEYDTAGWVARNLDDAISRLSALQNTPDNTILESYAYLGLDTVVQRSHPETGVNLSLINQPGGSTAAGDQYTGLDLFGRVIDQYWATAGGTVTDRFQYGYDRAGNRTYRLNALTHNNPLVPQGFDELYHNGTMAIDTYDPMTGNLTNAGYDRLNQLTAFRRGTLNMTNTDLTAGSQTRSQDWSLDVMGNWSALTTNGGTPQSRTHNQLNEVTAVGSAHPGFDGNGNTTLDETGKGFVYDAWNRLVRVNGASTPVAYTYDALGRRIQEAETATKDLYFSALWQVLEEQQGSPATTTAQYVWSPVYVDALVERDASGQRLYVQQDANFNVTALVNTAGAVVERYVYDPYGQPTFLTPTWTPLPASAYGSIYLHQGGRYDGTTGLYNFRNRDLSPTLGRWMQTDPIGYSAGDPNLYRFDQDNPIVENDPLGTVSPRKRPPTFVGWRISKRAQDLDMAVYVGMRCAVSCAGTGTQTGGLAWKAYQAGKKASAEANLVENSTRDRAFRHCVASGYLATLAGCACANCIGTERENWQTAYQVPRQSQHDHDQGIANNRNGLQTAGCQLQTRFVGGRNNSRCRIASLLDPPPGKSPSLDDITKSCRAKLDAETLNLKDPPK